jgi:hypothetical protein
MKKDFKHHNEYLKTPQGEVFKIEYSIKNRVGIWFFTVHGVWVMFEQNFIIQKSKT